MGLPCSGYINKYHRLGGFRKEVFLTILEAGSPRTRHQQGRFLLRLSPWLVDGLLLPVPSLGLLSICAFVLISSSYIGLGPALKTFHLMTSLKTQYPNTARF